MRGIGVGLIGLGNVGQGVVRLLREHAGEIAARLGGEIRLARVAVRDPARRRDVVVPPEALTADWKDVVRDRDVRVVVEVCGGVDPARRVVLSAIEAGKQVVTANKRLLAEHGGEIFAAAERAGVEVRYEAAVAGGLPVLRAIRDGLAADRVEAIWGIVNGTSNYVLGRMEETGASLAEAVAAAQRAGYAEADPALDLSGTDAMHKLAILVALAFGVRVPPSRIFTRGIDRVEPADLAWAARFGYRVKQLAIAKDHGDAIEARVHAALVPRSWLLASVSGAQNAVYVRSRALGSSLFCGAGAGGFATAVAVVGDAIDACRALLGPASASPQPARTAGTTPGKPGRHTPAFRASRDVPVREIGDLECRYYLRLACTDRPGVLAATAGALAAHGISIAEVVQERADGGRATLVLLTHRARERDVQTARGEIESLETVSGRARLLRMEE